MPSRLPDRQEAKSPTTQTTSRRPVFRPDPSLVFPAVLNHPIVDERLIVTVALGHSMTEGHLTVVHVCMLSGARLLPVLLVQISKRITIWCCLPLSWPVEMAGKIAGQSSSVKRKSPRDFFWKSETVSGHGVRASDLPLASTKTIRPY